MGKGITTSRLNLDELPDAMSQLLADYSREQFYVRQDAIQAGAEVFKSAIESATPRDTGGMAQSWEIKTKYKDRRYVGNTKTVSGKKDNIPLSCWSIPTIRTTDLYVNVSTAQSRKYSTLSKKN